MSRSEINEESALESDSFDFSYKLSNNVLDFETSLIWENVDLFTVYLSKDSFWDVNNGGLSQLFTPGNQCVWKIILVDKEFFEFSGIVNPSKVNIILTHPTANFINKLGIKRFAYQNKVDKFETFNLVYSNNDVVHGEVLFNNPKAYVINLLNNQESYGTFANYEIVLSTAVLKVEEEGLCEGARFVASAVVCDSLQYKVVQTNTTSPSSLQIRYDMVTPQLSGVFSKGDKVYSFGGAVNPNKLSPMCSSVSMYYNSSASPATPFALKYETNCINSVSAALNLFKNKTMAVHLVFDWNKVNKSIYVQGDNIYCKQWNVSASLSYDNGKNANLNVHWEENNVKVNLIVDQKKNIVFVINTSYDSLQKLEFVHGEKHFDQNFITKKYVGIFKVKGTGAHTEWNYEYKSLKNGTLIFTAESGKDLSAEVSLENAREINVRINKKGQIFEGSGFFKNLNNLMQGSVFLNFDGKQYKLSLEHLTSLGGELRTSVIFDTPLEQYFVKLNLKEEIDLHTSRPLKLLSIEYKTPYYPLDLAVLKLEYSVNPVISKTEILLKELKSSEKKVEEYELSYSEIVFKYTLKTKDINIENGLVHLTFGNKYSINLKLAKVNVKFETLLLNNMRTLASQSTIEVQGINHHYLRQKSFFKTYLDLETHNVIAYLESPLVETVSITLESQTIKHFDSEDYNPSSSVRTEKVAQVIYGKDIVLNFKSTLDKNKTMVNGRTMTDSEIEVLLNSQWHNKNILRSTVYAKLSNNQVSTANFNIGSEMATFKGAYMSTKTDKVISKSLELTYDSYVGIIHPTLVFKRQINEDSIEYNLNINNGFLDEKDFVNSSISLKIPDLSNFSIDSKPSITADIFMESHFAQYRSVFELLFQRNKLDAALKWRRLIKTVKPQDDQQFTSVLFGGEIKRNSADLYFNDNKFNSSIESTKSQTSVKISLTNSKLNKNFTVFASVQFTPLFLITMSHTVFDSPCSIEVKVNRKSQSIESAVIVVYNSLKQQAYANVYLDKSPWSVELVYIDIWQQMHQVSGQVEEKDDEMTIKGTINSPALDENFLIINIGNKNDKFDLNLSDMVIFKAFKDDESFLLNLLIFGNDYKLNHLNKSGTHELTLVSPVIHGTVSFLLTETFAKSFASGNVYFSSYHLVLDVNKNQIFNMSIDNETKNIVLAAAEFESIDGVCQLYVQCNYLNHTNSLSLKHSSQPILIALTFNSSFYLKNNLEIMLSLKNEEAITGIFEVKHKQPLIKSYLVFSKENNSLELIAEAPLFSYMDKAKINGAFKFVDFGDVELKLSGAISSDETLMAHLSLHLISSEEVFSTGLIIKNKIKDFNSVEIKVDLPLLFSRDMKANFVLQLPYLKTYEISSSLCTGENKVLGLMVFKWQDYFYSFEFRSGDTPFYSASYEWNLNYMDKKIQIGASTKPKYPLTDYIYFLDVNDKRLVQLSHALTLQHNHFKSKLVVESAFKGHEKYGIDLELQNLKMGKVVKVLGSMPQFGTDLGIDFAFSYESLMNYAVLAQIRVPHSNGVKNARLTSIQKIQKNLNSTKIKHLLECDFLGAVGWEFEMFGSAPFFWQGDLSTLETKFTIYDSIYSTKLKSYLQPSKIQLSWILEAPLADFKKGELHVTGTKELSGSELLLSLNSNEIVNATISKDLSNKNHITILSKWRNVLLSYLYEVYEEELEVGGYICWDLNKKNTSQIGLSVTGKLSGKYETSVELLLPSAIVPKLGAKAVLSNKVDQLFALLQLLLPTISVEGKVACDKTPDMWKSGLQLKWTPENSSSKDIGLFYVREVEEDEVKTYFTLQHFALKNDIMLSTYMRNTVYGVHLQYSPVKEEELKLELGYWTVQDEDKNRSGVKFTVLHPASNTLIYSVANVTSTVDSVEGGVSVAYSGKDFEKIRFVEIFGKKNRKVPQVFLGFTSNGNTLGVGGSIWKKDNSLQGITLEAQVNQNDPFRLEVVHDLVNPGVEAELSYSLSRTYRAYVGMPNNNELTAHLSHTMYGRPNTDALATLRLNSSKTLWGKFEFPPMTEVGQELYNGVLGEYAEINLVSQAISQGFIDFVNEDFSEKAILLLNSVSSQRSLLIEQTSVEMAVVVNGFGNFGESLQRCYEMDHFFIKTGVQHLKQWGMNLKEYTACVAVGITDTIVYMSTPVISVVSKVWELVEPVLQQTKIIISDLSSSGESSLSSLSELLVKYRDLRKVMIGHARRTVVDLRHKIGRWEHQSSEWLTQAELAVNRMAESVHETVSTHVQRVMDYTQTLLAGFSVLGKTVEEMVDIVVEGVYSIKEVRQTVEWIARAADRVNKWLVHFRVENYLRQMETFCAKVVSLIISDVDKNFGEYKMYPEYAQLFLIGKYEELSKIPEIHYIKTVINHVYQKARWVWSYTKMNERLREVVKKHLENLQATLDDIENRLDQDERDMRFEYEYNDENKSLTFSQELPFTWRAFNELPEYNMDDNGGFSVPTIEYSNMVQNVVRYAWQDAKLMPYILPPLGSDAVISGRKVVTFDNSYYEIPWGCGQYLLAADLHRHTFSLVLDFDQDKRDILLTTQGIDILIKNNFEVYINGQLEDLPLSLSNSKRISVERRPHSVYVFSEDGFNLECTAYQDQCRLHLDSWYTGKVAGLMGTYNNEPLDDFVDAARSPSESVENFVISWQTDDSPCEAVSVVESDSPSYESECELFFSSQSSPFVPCFHVVDPKAFYDMCLVNARKGNVCGTVFGYLTKCTSSGVQLWMPEFCVMDTLSETSGLESGFTTPSRMTADVVFVVEESDCVKTDKFNFGELSTTLDSELRSKGMTENNFAFISFSRKEAQIQTINGQIWTEDVKQLANIISRLDSTTSPSYVSALDLATSLEFRAGAAKLAVLVHCSSCPVDQSPSALLERLSHLDMTLHVLQFDEGQGRGRTVGKIIGEKKKRGELSTLLEQAPRDLCSSLVLTTNGTMFNMDVTHKSLRLWAGRVAQGAIPPTPTSLCETSLSADNTPVVRCHWARGHGQLKEWDQTSLDEYMDTSKAAEIYTEYEEVDR